MKNWILPAAGIVLIAAGAFGLSRGEFSYTKPAPGGDWRDARCRDRS